MTAWDSAHALTSDEVALAQVHVLAVADALHAMTSAHVAWRRNILRQTIVVRRAAQPTIAVRREEPRVMAVRIA